MKKPNTAHMKENCRCVNVVGLLSSLAATTICNVYRGECGIGGCIAAIKDVFTMKAKGYFQETPDWVEVIENV